MIDAYDPFDLPGWLGTEQVCFATSSALRETPRVEGTLSAGSGQEVTLDLLAVDAAYPTVVCPEKHRQAAHQAWQFGEVALGRVAAAVPGTRFDEDLACEVIRRVAKAVGATTEHFTVSLAL